MTTYLHPTPTSYSGEIVPRAAAALAVPAAAGSAALLPGYHELVPAAPAAPVRARRSVLRVLDRFAPLLASTPVTIAGRIWHYHGASHSLGDAFLLGAFSVGSLVASGIAAASKAVVIVGTGLALSGGLAAAAVAGYAHGWSPEAILWTLATAAGYGVKWPAWRAEENAAIERAERREIAERHETGETQREWIRAQRDLGIAAINAQAYVTGEQLKAETVRDVAARLAAPVVPDISPTLFDLSPAGQRALAEPMVMPAATELGIRAEQRQAA